MKALSFRMAPDSCYTSTRHIPRATSPPARSKSNTTRVFIQREGVPFKPTLFTPTTCNVLMSAFIVTPSVGGTTGQAFNDLDKLYKDGQHNSPVQCVSGRDPLTPVL